MGRLNSGSARHLGLDLGRALPGEAVVDLVGKAAERFLFGGIFKCQHLLLDCASHQDQHHQDDRVAQADQLQVFESALVCSRRGGQRRLARGVREHGHGQLHPLVQLEPGLVELMANHVLFG